MTNALKNQEISTFAPGMGHKPAQEATATRAVSARSDVIATSNLTPDGELDKQARNLVGQTFFGTLLKQMRDSPFKSELFSGGRGGQAFSGMYDQHLAQHMAQRSGAKLTRPIVKKYKQAAKDAYAKQLKAATQGIGKEPDHVPHDRRA